ncbi:hypothetical protein BGZ68_003671 [Mortierella alpina]|nr:hypothetical protein BGZ68_003671 [Mortierella alpina]
MLFSKSLIASALLVASLAVASVSAAATPSSAGTVEMATKESSAPKRMRSPRMRDSRKSSINIRNEKTIAIVDKRRFCMFLPPAPGDEVAPTEELARAFCMGKGIKSPNTIPKGFIRSALYQEDRENGFVQVTGEFNRGAYNLSATDGGGQYDSKNVRGSTCRGFPYFVSLVEPDVERYCTRCCKNKVDCPVNKSHLGCPAVIPVLP